MPSIRTVVLYTGNPPASRYFYADLLKLPVIGETHGRIELDAAGTRLLLHPTDTDSHDRAEARHGRMELYFQVLDLDATLQRLSAAGVEILQPVHDEPWGERDAGVLDPDGFPVYLTQPR